MDAAERLDGPALLQLDEELLRRAIAQNAAYADEARRDPAALAKFAFHTEEGAPLELLPHQHLFVRFVEDHLKSVVRMPTGASKTFLLSLMVAYELGRNQDTARVAMASATFGQAKKPIGYVRRMIEESDQLAQVFRRLQRHPDPNAPWRDDEFEVARRSRLRDPSARAVGFDSEVTGSRWSHLYVDDLLTDVNTSTLEARDQLHLDFDTEFRTRVDQKPMRTCITNTPWHPDDLTYRYGKLWPSLTMNVEGDVHFGQLTNARIEELYGDLVVRRGEERWRLRDPAKPKRELEILWAGHPLWGSRQLIDELKQTTLPFAYARTYACDPLDDGSHRCKREWVQQAIEAGRGLLLGAKPGPYPRRRVTGVDVGGIKRDNDLSSIATVEEQEDHTRRLVNLQSGHWTGPELADKVADEALLYDSEVYVESNAAQRAIAEFTQQLDRRLRVHAFYTTDVAKGARFTGVEAVFTELMRGLWELPSADGSGDVPRVIKALEDECVFYSPTKHMGDHLAALWLARQGLATRADSRADAKRARASGPRAMARSGGF